MFGFYQVVVGSNAGPNSCSVSTILTELFCQLLFYCVKRGALSMMLKEIPALESCTYYSGRCSNI